MNLTPHEISQRNVAVLGAGPEQLHAIRLAQELGLRVLAFDRNPSAPGLTLADEGFAIDPSDRAAVMTICRSQRVRFLLPTPMGALLETAGLVNEALGLPGIRAHPAHLCSDKLAMRNALLKAGLAQPRFVEVHQPEEVNRKGDDLGWPIIIKPRTGSGSHGVVVLTNEEEGRRHLEWHRNQADRGNGHGSTLVEEWIDGPEFGLDAAMVGGRFREICLRRKEVTPLPFRLALGVSTPPQLTDAQSRSLIRAAEDACRALALDDCLVHVDLILEVATDRAFVVELGGRPSGFRISSLFVPLLKGFDPAREMILHYSGEHADFTSRADRAGVMRMLSAPEGLIASVSGVERAKSVNGIVAFECPLAPGSIVGRADSGSNVLGNGYVVAVAASVGEAMAACDEATAHLRVEVEPEVFTS